MRDLSPTLETEGIQKQEDAMLLELPAEETAQTQGRGWAYAFLANAFRYPDRAWIESITEAGHSCDGTACVRAVGPEVAAHWEAVCARFCSQGSGITEDIDGSVAELQTLHGKLFGHAVRGLCPPYELEYGQSEIIQQASELADISGFYAAFGMMVSPHACDRPDHIAVECEFMSVLCAKEAQTREVGNADAVERAWHAQRTFLRDHLARWVPAFALRIEKNDSNGWYSLLARFAHAFVLSECRRFDVTIGSDHLELRPVDPVLDAAIDCDGGRPACPEPSEPWVQLRIDTPPKDGSPPG